MKARERANQKLDHIEERPSEHEFSDYGDEDKYRIKSRRTNNASPGPPSEFFGPNDDYDNEEDGNSGKKSRKKSKKKGPGIFDSSPHDLVGDEEIGSRHISPTKVANSSKGKAPRRGQTEVMAVDDSDQYLEQIKAKSRGRFQVNDTALTQDAQYQRANTVDAPFEPGYNNNFNDSGDEKNKPDPGFFF